MRYPTGDVKDLNSGHLHVLDNSNTLSKKGELTAVSFGIKREGERTEQRRLQAAMSIRECEAASGFELAFEPYECSTS